ncbi:hypothetical protein GCM10020000_52670 [Streptomyces olivoverticillatus]
MGKNWEEELEELPGFASSTLFRLPLPNHPCRPPKAARGADMRKGTSARGLTDVPVQLGCPLRRPCRPPEP